jgi:hypothetical protein
MATLNFSKHRIKRYNKEPFRLYFFVNSDILSRSPDMKLQLWKIYTPFAGAVRMLLINGKFIMGKLK